TQKLTRRKKQSRNCQQQKKRGRRRACDGSHSSSEIYRVLSSASASNVFAATSDKIVPTAGFISPCWRHTLFANSQSKVPPVALPSGCNTALNLEPLRRGGLYASLSSSRSPFNVKLATV